MEPCLLIEGVKWTASSWRTRLIRQRMPREKWRQTETVKRRSRGTLKRRPRLARRPDAGCSLSCTQLSRRSVDGTIIPRSAAPWLSTKSCCSRSRTRARSDWCPPPPQCTRPALLDAATLIKWTEGDGERPQRSPYTSGVCVIIRMSHRVLWRHGRVPWQNQGYYC